MSNMKTGMRKFSGLLLIVSVILLGYLSSCNNYNQEKLRKQELELLDNYIIKNKITVSPTNSGLYYIEVKKGTGDTIQVGDRVQIWYKTYLLSDSTLIDDSGRYNPLEFYCTTAGSSSVIEGLNEAVKFMQKGTIANLIIPSELAYGQNGTTGISGFTSLLMNVEVYKVYKASN